MNCAEFENLLIDLEACEEARIWARGKSLSEGAGGVDWAKVSGEERDGAGARHCCGGCAGSNSNKNNGSLC